MTPRREWKTRLLPYARLYDAYIDAVESKIRELSSEELTALAEAAEEPTQTNCWWATYWAAREVREAATREMNRRRHAKTAEGVG
jgi:hypothetical protein